MHFEDWMELVVKGFEVAGVVILAVGSLAALTNATIALFRGDRRVAYADARRNIGRAVLLGLEVLIIADIVQTVTVDPTAESALVLAVIVLVRTFLSFSLEIELEGVVPWHRAATIGRRAELTAECEEILGNSEVAYVHIRSKFNCFQCRVDRGNQSSVGGNTEAP